MAIPYLMDVHVPVSITDQLRRRGINVITAQECGLRTMNDASLLNRSKEINRVIFTQDIRFRVMAEQWMKDAIPFSGLVYGHQELTIGRTVTDLEIVSKCLAMEDVKNQVIHLPI